MKEKWIQLETFHKSFIVSMVYAIVAIIICGGLTVINNSFLYGALLGTILLLISYTLIWVLVYKIPSIKQWMAKSIPWLSPLIRIVIYITVLLLVIFLVNDRSTGLTMVSTPINTLVLLIVYTITPISYGTALVIDIILEKKGGEK